MIETQINDSTSTVVLMSKEDKDNIFVQNLEAIKKTANKIKRLRQFKHPLLSTDDVVQNSYLKWVTSPYNIAQKGITPLVYINGILFQEYLDSKRRIVRNSTIEPQEELQNNHIEDYLTYSKICSMILEDYDKNSVNYKAKDLDLNIIDLLLKGCTANDILNNTEGASLQRIKNVKGRIKERYKNIVKENN